ncbi:MAG: DUF4338 domain-containing protein [Christensenellaceae bacterium]|nr:DUF4338 domain-containing protein [Christensenellaceae bacterium]
MIKIIAFRPKLDCEFRTRFYSKAMQITAKTTREEFDAIVSGEITWVESDGICNLEQRRKYRAVWLLLRDLMRASWTSRFRAGTLELRAPGFDSESYQKGSLTEKKAEIRELLKDSCNERLVTSRNFVNLMEAPKAPNKRSILTIIADGDELADRLKNAKEITEAVRPYLQLVDGQGIDDVTGHPLSEIWRYFRLTWSTPAENTPGRTMQYLVRDLAHPNLPVMGIISLENCSVQISDRDNNIGWNTSKFIEDIAPYNVFECMDRLLSYIKEGLSGIDYSSICTDEEIESPTDECVAALMQISIDAEKHRRALLKSALNSNDNSEVEMSDLGLISLETEYALYRKKRAEQVSRLLGAKKFITDLTSKPEFRTLVNAAIEQEETEKNFSSKQNNYVDDEWKKPFYTQAGYSAIRNALVAQKSRHIGTSMLELNVCGAIPPYNEILGGKLAALLALTPRIIYDYKVRYGARPSEIATRLKGEPVVRPADLVYAGTTSLYFVGSSQYNRLKIPKEILGGDYDIKWKRLGQTTGFGTAHIGRAASAALVEAAENVGYTRINHVFGEGASPKLRLFALSIRGLLEVTPDEAIELSKHAMSRIVYGACLAGNTKDYLLGKDKVPRFYFETPLTEEVANKKTNDIIKYWSERWLASRVRHEPIFERLRTFDKNKLRVSRRFSESNKWEFKRLEENSVLEYDKNGNAFGIDFIKSFYNGEASYADTRPIEVLKEMHVATKIDGEIQNAIKLGRDIIVTGIAGDGKTHILRVVADAMKDYEMPLFVMDASQLSYEELYSSWITARQEQRPFVIAIDCETLELFVKKYSDFMPAVTALRQITREIDFDCPETEASENISVFDLSRRDILNRDFVYGMIKSIASDRFYTECNSCAIKNFCPATINRELISDDLFIERLCALFERATLSGAKVTPRELLAFISFLIFGNRTCKTLAKTAGECAYKFFNFMYSAESSTVTSHICKAFDPIYYSHPIIDEELLGVLEPTDEWSNPHFCSYEAINGDNFEQFETRKRAFYFFNKRGSALLDIQNDDLIGFKRLLNEDDDTCIRDIVGKLNSFFIKRCDTAVDIWNGHNYDGSICSVYLANGHSENSTLEIERPNLTDSASAAVDVCSRYFKIVQKNNPSAYLRVDFNVYSFLLKAERGMPLILVENNEITKQILRFVERLKSDVDSNSNSTTDIKLLQIKDATELNVTVDLDKKKYLSIDIEHAYRGRG